MLYKIKLGFQVWVWVWFRINKMCSTISREEIEDNKSSQDITKSVNVDKLNWDESSSIGSSSRKGYATVKSEIAIDFSALKYE